jgi:hypothetical protein
LTNAQLFAEAQVLRPQQWQAVLWPVQPKLNGGS